MDFEVKSLKKKFKDKRFAATRHPAPAAGWELDDTTNSCRRLFRAEVLRADKMGQPATGGYRGEALRCRARPAHALGLMKTRARGRKFEPQDVDGRSPTMYTADGGVRT